jgi:hypothetical protein
MEHTPSVEQPRVKKPVGLPKPDDLAESLLAFQAYSAVRRIHIEDAPSLQNSQLSDRGQELGRDSLERVKARRRTNRPT